PTLLPPTLPRSTLFPYTTLFRSLSLIGCKVSPPSALERAVAKQVKQKITVRGKDDVNPLPPTLENIKAGQQAFSHYCMVCHGLEDRKSTRLNSSHGSISYAVFCL